MARQSFSIIITGMSKESVDHYNQLMLELEKNLNETAEFIQHLKENQKIAKNLSDYLETDWLSDYDKYKQVEGNPVLGEDYVYNLLAEFREQQVKILKIIVNDL